jgi:Sigma-70 region 2
VTAAMSVKDAAASFDPLRPRLTRVAYRMLRSVADAEDIVQDAFLRWLAELRRFEDSDRLSLWNPESRPQRSSLPGKAGADGCGGDFGRGLDWQFELELVEEELELDFGLGAPRQLYYLPVKLLFGAQSHF